MTRGGNKPVIQTARPRDMVGYWNVAKLLKNHELNTRKENDICICGHPRFMHYKGEDSTFCRVHGCREPNNHLDPCLHFTKDKSLHNETL